MDEIDCPQIEATPYRTAQYIERADQTTLARDKVEDEQVAVDNAQRVARAFADRVRFVYPWGKWIIYNGECWAIDEYENGIIELARQAVRAIADHRADIADTDYAAQNRHQYERGSYGRAVGLLEAAKKLPSLRISHTDLDPHRNLLACKNGVIDLTNGRLREHDSKLFCSQSTGIDFPTSGPPPKEWKIFLGAAFADCKHGGRIAVVKHLQRLLGVALLGTDNILPVFFGGGLDSKILADTVVAALGEHAVVAPPYTKLDRRKDVNTPTGAHVFGRRLVFAHDCRDGYSFDEDLIRKITDRQTITARRIHELSWEYKQTHSLICTTKRRPSITTKKKALRDRVHLLRYRAQIRERDEDELREKLADELPAILRWLVDGCVQYSRYGWTKG